MRPASRLVMQGLVLGACTFAVGQVQAQTSEQSGDVVRAEAPIVAGNAVSAKQRALADAFRQLVERAFAQIIKDGEPLPQPWPDGVVQLKASFASAAQKFVRSYRVIEQSSEGGVLRMMIEADVDSVLLRREIDRARGGARAVAASARTSGVLLVAGTPGNATPLLVRDLVAAGVPAQAERAKSEAHLVANASQRSAHALFVVESTEEEGIVRGTTQVSVRCSLAPHLYQAGGPAGRPVFDQVREDRGFGTSARVARDACLERVASSLTRAVVAKLRALATGASFITLQLDIVDPGAVTLVLRACKRMGSVTAAEVRQVMANSAEMRVFTRMGGPALQQALVRDLSGKLALVPTHTGSDSLSLRVRQPDSSALEENP